MRRLEAIWDADEACLRAPALGVWRGGPPNGAMVTPACPLGALEVLGELLPLVAPARAAGMVVSAEALGDGAERPVGYGDVLLRLDLEAAPAQLGADSEEQEEGALVLRASSYGRFYLRPGPDKPAFVEVGDVLTLGKPVGLLEVMKTFTRVLYEGPGLPPRAKVVRIAVEDGADIAEGEALLQLEPA